MDDATSVTLFCCCWLSRTAISVFKAVSLGAGPGHMCVNVGYSLLVCLLYSETVEL